MVFLTRSIGLMIVMGTALAAQASEILWTVSGKVSVEESASTGTLKERPLTGATVEVLGASVGRVYESWGVVAPDSQGAFQLKVRKTDARRHFKVRIRFESMDGKLSVRTPLRAAPFRDEWYTLTETSATVAAPRFDVGTRVFKAQGGPNDLTNTDNARRAAIFYLCHTAMSHLATLDYPITQKLRLLYPADSKGRNIRSALKEDPWLVGLLRRRAEGDDYVRHGAHAVLYLLMALWFEIRTWGNASSDLPCYPKENGLKTYTISSAFTQGFAEWGKDMLLTEIWGAPKIRPATRHSLAIHGFNTLQDMETRPLGVTNALHLLTTHNVYLSRFGTKSAEPTFTYPQGGAAGGQTVSAEPLNQYSSGPDWRGAISVGLLPVGLTSPTLTFSDILNSFRTDQGWGSLNRSEGLFRQYGFFNRLTSIQSRFGITHPFTEADKSRFQERLNPSLTVDYESY